MLFTSIGCFSQKSRAEIWSWPRSALDWDVCFITVLGHFWRFLHGELTFVDYFYHSVQKSPDMAQTGEETHCPIGIRAARSGPCRAVYFIPYLGFTIWHRSRLWKNFCMGSRAEMALSGNETHRMMRFEATRSVPCRAVCLFLIYYSQSGHDRDHDKISARDLVQKWPLPVMEHTSWSDRR